MSDVMAMTFAALPPVVDAYLPWFIAGAIVLVGLVLYGFRDLTRFSVGRITAIASVCFRDAIRRRVLWITPLAMLGILIVSQLQKPLDEQDAIRQTIKFCFFTTGLVVTVITIITSVTNLPREIENRVVFTIVTKPVTRLEIVIGKIAGFATVSAMILLIMGAFSLGYLQVRSWLLGRQIAQTLQSTGADPSSRAYLEHFRDQGLLFSQTVTGPTSLSQYARMPLSPSDRVIQGGVHDAVAVFQIERDGVNQLAPQGIPGAPPGSLGVAILLNVGFERLRAPADANATPTDATPNVALQVIDARTRSVVFTNEQVLGAPPPVEGQPAPTAGRSLTLNDPTGANPLVVPLTAEVATKLGELKNFFIQVLPTSQDHLYRFGEGAVSLLVPEDESGTKFRPVPAAQNAQLRGSEGRSGQQLRGPERGLQPVAIYQFRNVNPPTGRDGQVPFELTVGLETSGADADTEVATTVEVRVYDRPNKKLSDPVLVFPESRRTFYFSLPQSYLGSKDFDVVMTNKTVGHVVGITQNSLQLVAGREPFAMNFLKGSVVLWLLSVLVATIAFCCSTFLSWPIAAVLSVLIILGKWGVSNLDIGTGLGAQFAQEFFPSGNNASSAKVVNTTVEALTSTLLTFSKLLPDITPFGVTEQIEQGVTITWAQMVPPLQVLLVFGLPLLTASYVFLRNKEVAP